MLALCLKEDFKCWICGEEVPIDYEVGSPIAPSKDHVVPRSKFKKNPSEYTLTFFRNNIRLAHRHCNSERQSRQVDEKDAESYADGLAKAQTKWDTEH